MALYEDPELENGNEESTGDPSFGRGGLGSTIRNQVRHELFTETVVFIRDLFFGGDDDDD